LSYQTTGTNLKKKPNLFYGYEIVAFCYVTAIVVWGTFNSFGVFFDSLLNEFHWTRAATSGAFSLCTVISGLAAIPFGRITDRFGPRLVMTVCSLVLGAGYILMALINSIWQFYLIYGIIIGVGTSGFWVPVLSTVSRWFSRKRGLMVAIVLTGSGAGTIVFPPFANWLISQYQWRLSIAIIGIISLVTGTVLSQFMKRDPSQTAEFPDGVPAVKEDPARGTNLGYSIQEAARTPQFWMAGAIFFCCGFCAYTIFVHIIPQALLLGVSSTAAAGIVAVIGGVAILGGLGTGIMADRTGVKKSTVVFLVLAVLALIWLNISRDFWQLYLFAAVFGLAYGSIGVSETILSVWLFGLRDNALILSVIDFGLTIGAAVGPLIAGYIFDITGSYQIAFFLTAFICFSGLVLSLFIKPPAVNERRINVS
jgi:MFS family permease